MFQQFSYAVKLDQSLKYNLLFDDAIRVNYKYI